MKFASDTIHILRKSYQMFDRGIIRKCLVLAGLLLAIGVAASGQMQEFENRKEGRRIQPNALPDFTLLALHKNFIHFDRNSNLKVRFFVPKVPGSPHVFVEAVERIDSSQYYMRSNDSFPWKEGSWNVFGPWPTRDVIDGLGLNSENVLVLAQYQLGNSRRVYLPADVYQSEGDLTGKTYKFHFRTGQDVQSLDISVINDAGVDMTRAQVPGGKGKAKFEKTNRTGTDARLTIPQLKCNTSLNPNCKKYGAGSTLNFDLDFSGLSEGEYHVRLIGHVPGNLRPTSLDILMHHHP
jgi:hypothetical protein